MDTPYSYDTDVGKTSKISDSYTWDQALGDLAGRYTADGKGVGNSILDSTTGGLSAAIGGHKARKKAKKKRREAEANRKEQMTNRGNYMEHNVGQVNQLNSNFQNEMNSLLNNAISPTYQKEKADSDARLATHLSDNNLAGTTYGARRHQNFNNIMGNLRSHSEEQQGRLDSIERGFTNEDMDGAMGRSMEVWGGAKQKDRSIHDKATAALHESFLGDLHGGGGERGKNALGKPSNAAVKGSRNGIDSIAQFGMNQDRQYGLGEISSSRMGSANSALTKGQGVMSKQAGIARNQLELGNGGVGMSGGGAMPNSATDNTAYKNSFGSLPSPTSTTMGGGSVSSRGSAPKYGSSSTSGMTL